MQAYRNCPRFRYLHYHHDGLGLEPKSLALPLITGIHVHEALADVLQGMDPFLAVNRAFESYTRSVDIRGITGVDSTAEFLAEQKALLQGLVLAWFRVRYPQILAEFEPVLIEREMLWTMGVRNGYEIQDMIRADALLRRRSDGTLFYLEFKTTTKGDEYWIRSWEHNSQLLINTLAIEELLGERLGGVMIEGLIKGRRAKCTLKSSRFLGKVIQDSPFCYAFRSVDNFGGAHFEPSWSRGAEHVRVSDYFRSADKWIDQLDEEVLRAQFVPVPPIRPRPDQLNRHRRQMLFQEEQVAWALDELRSSKGNPELQREILDCYFPQNDDHCNRYYGSPCSMEEVCFNQTVAADPYGSGLYLRRTPHHSPEAHRVESDANSPSGN